jgi:hypothetical protein
LLNAARSAPVTVVTTVRADFYDPLIGHLDEAGEDEGTLPLLQYALKETWTQRKGNAMTADSYARSGGVPEAIRITAERTFDALSTEDQQAARTGAAQDR